MFQSSPKKVLGQEKYQGSALESLVPPFHALLGLLWGRPLTSLFVSEFRHQGAGFIAFMKDSSLKSSSMFDLMVSLSPAKTFMSFAVLR